MKKYQNIIIQVVVFIITHFIAVTYFKDVYPIDWIVKHNYLGVFAFTIALTIFDKTFLGYALIISNSISMVLGLIIGDWRKAYGMSMITPGMDAQKVAELSADRGVYIYIGCLLLLFILSIIIKKIVDRRKRVDNTKRRFIMKKYYYGVFVVLDMVFSIFIVNTLFENGFLINFLLIIKALSLYMLLEHIRSNKEDKVDK